MMDNILFNTDSRGLIFDNPNPNPNPREIQQTVNSAFIEVQRHHPLDMLIQFWSPVETGGIITTYDQPFAFKHLDSNGQKHRICCLKYQYNIDPNKAKLEGEAPLIINGAPANAFLNHLAEVVLDLRIHEEDNPNPLVRSALECGFISYFVMPICRPFQRSCVGVVECCANNYDDLFKIFRGTTDALKAVGLSTFHGQQKSPYKTIGGLKRTKKKIEVALWKVCESYDLSLAQVSIAYGDGNLISSSSLSLENNKHMKSMLALKLVAPYIDKGEEDKLVFIDHCDSCDMVPLRIWKGLSGKALQNYAPHFCKNIYGMTGIEQQQLPATNTITKLSCFVICLRSIDTHNLDYVFEFLWPQYRNHFTIIESLMSILKIQLPNFKFASGAQLGDDLQVVDVAKSMTYKTNIYVGVPPVKRKGLVCWREPKRVKRKANTHRAILVQLLVVDPEPLAIKAEYQGKMVILYFPPSLTETCEAVEKAVARKLKLIRGSFELTYRDENEKVVCFVLVSDEDVSHCLSITPIAKIYIQNIVRMD